MKGCHTVYFISNLVDMVSEQEDCRLLGCDAMYCDIHWCRGAHSCIL